LNHIIALCGMSASGKDTIQKILQQLYGYKPIVSITTRPKRSGETDGVAYYFKTEDEFKKLLNDNQLIEYRIYNTIQEGKPTTWYYGIENNEVNLKKYNHVTVVDLQGLRDIKKQYDNSIISIYIDSDEESRKLRAIARDLNFELDEWNRRLKDDERVFSNVKHEVDFIVYNYDFKACLKEIIKKVNKEIAKRTFFQQYCSY
jgi:guanylate kinase